ncbi:hypothetical protein [Actinomadura alba]|uniref:Uncharacterized protein n=1 Tax=Actinomadura alba TaxID=406431 RepID=A0ABR7LRH5_9ACTN|nr:hypothetical protein [Actinomadura alba]MBC6467097.1 hypothetical protein [Actinomadura alba]
MIESQLNYLIDALRVLDRRGVVALDTRRDRQGAYNAGIQWRFARSVWTTGRCTSRCLAPDGRDGTLRPDYSVRFRHRIAGCALATTSCSFVRPPRPEDESCLGTEEGNVDR